MRGRTCGMGSLIQNRSGNAASEALPLRRIMQEMHYDALIGIAVTHPLAQPGVFHGRCHFNDCKGPPVIGGDRKQFHRHA